MLTPSKSVLVVIDVQGKLAYMMHERDPLFKHIQALITIAKILDIPIFYTEQAPQKIGATIPEIKDLLPDHQPIIKDSFSCFIEPSFLKALKASFRKNVIIVGIETHVCIFQTVADLIENSYPTYVVVDAVSSRSEANKTIALNRMSKLGAELVSTEMIATELLRTSKHPRFKEILSLIR
jgi:nicotinamidase-related amidase